MPRPPFDIQPTLETVDYNILPIDASDFNDLFHAASDPLIWEQHPNKDRWKKDVFRTFFEGAILSKGALKIIDKNTMQIIGSTRVYDYSPENDSIMIGYTFYAREYWGKGANHIIKRLLIDYLFGFVSKVVFHIGATNIRSQISIQRLGAIKVGEIDVAYHGEPVRLNFVYELERSAIES
jgi:N-acetyltransferase